MFSVFAIYYEDLQYRLKIREEQYQKLFNQSPAGMLLLDRNGVIITVNQAICQYTGYSKEELEGTSMFKNLVPLEYKIRAQKNIREILNGEDKEYIMKTYDKNNKLKYFLMKETKFVQADFSTAVLSMRIDYTDYKTKEEEIRYLSYHDNLTKRICFTGKSYFA
ncbi:MAG: PAS domain S-box protein [Halanaerobium sp.]